jgi:hypothetical protein
MFSLFKKRPRLSQRKATRVALAVLPVYLARYPGMFPTEQATLLYKSTGVTTNCWVLFWNSKAYAKSRNFADQWIGPGPILVDKWTGHVRIYPSGGDWNIILYDYDQDIVAAGKAWVLSVIFDASERATLLSRLKAVLGLTLQEIAGLKSKLPGPLFTGRRRCMEWLAGKLVAAGIPAQVELCAPATAAALEWVHIAWPQYPAEEELKRSRDYPEVHGGWLNFREFACPLPNIVEWYGVPPPRAFQMTEEEQNAHREKMFDQAALAGHATALWTFLSMHTDPNRHISFAGGATALLVAARLGYEEAVKVLLMYGADTTVKDAQGRTALEIALESGHTSIAGQLQGQQSR